MSKSLKFFSLLIIIGISLSSVAIAEIVKEKDGYSENIEQSFTVEKNQILKIQSVMGPIKATLSDSNQLLVSIKKTAKTSSESNAREILESVWVDLLQEDDVVTVTIKSKERRINRNCRISISVSVPKDMDVDFHTGGGSIEVTGLSGKIKSSTGAGPLIYTNITGEVQGSTGYGEIKADRTTGNLTASTKSGSIEIISAKEGLVDVSTGNGIITISDTSSDLKAKTIGGTIKIKNTSGSVYVNTGGGSISIEKTKGKIEASTGGGSITVNASRGPVDISTTVGVITIFNAESSINASTAAGTIKAKVLKLDKDGVKMTTGGGKIILYLPEKIPATLDLKINIGRRKNVDITSDFDIEVTKGQNKITGKGNINGGGPIIKLITTGGNIKIKKFQ